MQTTSRDITDLITKLEEIPLVKMTYGDLKVIRYEERRFRKAVWEDTFISIRTNLETVIKQIEGRT